MQPEHMPMSDAATRLLGPSVRLLEPADLPLHHRHQSKHSRRSLITALLLVFAAVAVSVGVQFTQQPASGEAVASVDAVVEAPAAAAVEAVAPAEPPVAPAAAEAAAPLPAAAPSAASRAPAVVALGARLRIPRIGVDAPMITMGLGANGQMPAPPDDSSVAWYDFSAAPGGPGNALLAGHVDWVDHGAVFWHLRTVVPGDSITVTSGGQTFVYSVDRVYTVPFDVADTSGIVGRRSGSPTLTIVTCAGTFNAARHLYDQRLVVVSSLRS